MNFLLESANLPFTVAIAVLLGLFLVEIAALIVGTSLIAGDGFDADVDIDLDIDAGFVDGLLNFLGIGRVPLGVWIALFAGTFGIFGLALNQVSTQVVNMFLPTMLSVPLALIPTFFVVGKACRLIARIIPKDETYAVTMDSLIGLEGTVTVSPTNEVKGRARVYDKHGTHHNITFVTTGSESIPVGSKVRLESLSNQGHFFISTVA